MRSRKIQWTFLWLLSLLLTHATIALGEDLYEEFDETFPKSRVARISLVNGETQLKRNNENDWEDAVNNLPLVEGDQITTGENSRLEIQLDNRNFIRLNSNSFLKIVTLRNEGIALSLPEGTLSLRIAEFNKDREYFEIDAPDTTFAIESKGHYRIDSIRNSRSEVRIVVTDGGKARVYSTDSGFTVKDGKSARMFRNGNNESDWETISAKYLADEFDNWVSQREAKILSWQKNDYRGRYYDDDVIGVDELNEYGEWINTSSYGYVWRPYNSSISRYSNWSPYRYGYWRYRPPFGWIWVSDEPWGWSTNHYGRWVYDSGNWCWTPRSYSRKRQVWHPALVVINYSRNNDICWYPAPYRSRTFYRSRHRDNDNRDNNIWRDSNRSNGSRGRNRDHENFNPYRNAVTGIYSSEFGRGRRSNRSISPENAGEIIQNGEDHSRRLPNSPGFNQSDRRGENRQRENSRGFRREEINTGAAERRIGSPMDENLRRSRVFNNRTPIDRSERQREPSNTQQNPNTVDTGVLQRSERRRNNSDERERQRSDSPGNRREERRSNENQNIQSPQNENKERNREPRVRPIIEDQPVNPPQNTQENNNEERRPRSEPRREEPRREEPRSEPRREEPRRNEPRQEQPRREEYRREQPRQEERRIEPRREEPRREQPREEQPRREERREQPRQESPRQEQPRREERREQPRSEPKPPPNVERPSRKENPERVEKPDNR